MQKYQALKSGPAANKVAANLTVGDRWAQSWLADNLQCIDIPAADKALGTVSTMMSDFADLVATQLV